jgi:hypothetical protein
MRRVVFALLLWLLPASASAATYYVDDGGAHGVNCTQYQNIATPSATIAAALTCMSGGGNTVLVRAGTYNEHFEPGQEGLTWASGTSWANKNRLANYPNGCSPRAANPCGTPGEDVILAPLTSTINGGGIIFGVYADIAYIEIDGINIDMSIGVSGYQGDFSFPYSGIIGGAFAANCYQNHSGGFYSNFIRLKNLEMIGLDGYQPDNVRGQAISAFHQRVNGNADTNCPGGHEFQNLKIHGGATDETGWSSCVPSGGNDYCRYTGYAYYINADNVLVENNDIYDTRLIGIQLNATGGLAETTGTIIRNNRFHDINRGGYYGSNTTTAIILADHSTGAQIYNNVLYNNGTSVDASYGIYCYTSTSPLIANNTVYHQLNGTGIQIGEFCSGAVVRNNIAYNNASNYSNQGSGTSESNTVTTNPQFVNAAAFDFHLTVNSTAVIDTGCNPAQCPGVPPTDADGVARPQGSSQDIGAYEYTSGSGVLPTIATNFVPANGATGVDLFPHISWTAGANTDSFDLYYDILNGQGVATFVDLFDRGNSSDLGVTWTPYGLGGFGPAQIVNQRIRNTLTTVEAMERVTGTLFERDQWARLRIPTYGTGIVSAALMLRLQPGVTVSGYFIGAARGYGTVRTWAYRYDNNAFTFLASEDVTPWAAADILEAHMIGNVLTIYRNGNSDLRLSATDSTYPTGTPGLYLYADTLGQLEADNFEAGNWGPRFVQNQIGVTYDPPAANPNTAYYWKVISRNSFGVTPGPDLQFVTLGTTATPVGVRLRFKSP